MQIINKTNGETRNELSVGKAKVNGFWVVEDNAPILDVPFLYWKAGANAWTPIEMSQAEKESLEDGALAVAQNMQINKVGNMAKSAIKAMVDQELVLAQLFLSTQTDSTTEMFTIEEKALLRVSIETSWAKWLQKKAAIMMASTVEEVKTIVW